MNLAMTAALVAGWLLLSGRAMGWTGLLGGLRRIFLRKRYWWNRSTRVDYAVYLLNSLLKVFLFVPLLDLGYFFSTSTARLLLSLNGGEFPGLHAGFPWLPVFTLFAFAFDDFLRFLHHWLMHKVPFLWRFHRTHHSARVLTPITLYRAHPVESAIATVRNSLSLGLSTGVFVFLFDARFSAFTFLGVNVFGFVFNLLGSNLRHSHVPLSFGPLERVFISPKQHQIHHSRDSRHFDRNFGVSLALWDWLLGSLVFSREAKAPLRFGLENGRAGSLWRQLRG